MSDFFFFFNVSDFKVGKHMLIMIIPFFSEREI